MEMNKELQKIYKYLVENVNDKEISQLIIYLQDYTINGSMQDFDIDYRTNNLEQGVKEEIYFILNNCEDEKFVQLTDEQCDDIVDNIIDNVMNDEEIWREFNDSVSFYINHYLNKKGE